MEDLIEAVDSTSETTQIESTEVVETTPEETIEQDPLKVELEKVQKKGRTEVEKAAFTLKKNAERLKELGGDPNTILGIEKETTETDEDDTIVTVGMLKKLQQQDTAKTALEQADEIKNETERELVRYHLENTIKSTGNPTEDLKLARALVNAVKNTQIMEEANRKPPVKTHSSGSGVDAINTEVKGELTPTEIQFMGAPFNLTREQILKARQK